MFLMTVYLESYDDFDYNAEEEKIYGVNIDHLDFFSFSSELIFALRSVF